MPPLPSGLPDIISEEEPLARFLPSKNYFNSVGPKGAAFLPNPKHRNTSVFRIGNDPERLRQTWSATSTGDRSLKGAAIFRAIAVRRIGLMVVALEPPPAHANIEGWPWDSDPALQKGRQLELANQIAASAELVRL